MPGKSWVNITSSHHWISGMAWGCLSQLILVDFCELYNRDFWKNKPRQFWKHKRCFPWSTCLVSRWFSKCTLALKSRGTGKWHWASLLPASSLALLLSPLMTVEQVEATALQNLKPTPFYRQPQGFAPCAKSWRMVLAETRFEIFSLVFCLSNTFHLVASIDKEWGGDRASLWITMAHSESIHYH